MNICWIEDFGGNNYGDEHLANALFSEFLIGDENLFDDWEYEGLTEDEACSALPKYTRDQSCGLHQITLFRHYTDYCQYHEKRAIPIYFDIYVIDIRLNEGLPANPEYPEGFENEGDKVKFNEHAGLFIYNDLICRGVSTKAIAILTGEHNTLEEFKNKQKDLYWSKLPIAFEKQDGFEGVNKWLCECNNNQYAAIRRSLLVACEEVHTKDNQMHRYINKDENGVLQREFTDDQFKDYLKAINKSVSCPQVFSNAPYDSLTALLLHPWDNVLVRDTSMREQRSNNTHNADISSAANNNHDDNVIFHMIKILKTARNWASHGTSLQNESGAELAAYLMLLNFRCMVHSSLDAISPYEEMLLRLLEKPGNNDNVQNVDRKRHELWSEITRDELDAGKNPFGLYINKTNNWHQESCKPNSTKHDFKRYLMGMIFFVDLNDGGGLFLNRLQRALCSCL